MFHFKNSIMSKRTTSFLVLAAALLLSLPSGAQNSKAPKKKAGTELAGQKRIKASELNAVRTKTLAAQQTVADEKKPSLEEEQYLIDKAAKEAAASEVIPQVNWASLERPQFVPKNGLFKNVPVKNCIGNLSKEQTKKNDAAQAELFKQFNPATASANKAPRKAETVDEHGIITAPAEGETKYYARTGTAFYYSGGSAYTAEQSGHVTIVETSDGTVYIKDPVTRYTQGTWVKGTKEGNTITVAGAQPLGYSDSYDATLSLNWGTKNESGYTRGTGDITFTIDGNTITLQSSSADNIIGIFWDDDNSWQGYGDYGTVWTLDDSYVPPSTDLVELPAGATVETWYREQTDQNGATVTGTDVNVAFVDNDVYISGIFSDFPDSWIKGTISGTTVTFESEQFIGNYGTTPIWAYGTDGESLVDAFTMTYDATAKTLTSTNQLLGNAAEDRIYYLQWISALTLYAEAPAPTQIDELPYSNDFSDASLQKHFTVINANNDGVTWGASNGEFVISYAAPNDDWLVSPAIKLVAGKKYHFAIDSKVESTNYPETFEVKAAKEATADALSAGTVVLAEQTINNKTDYSTYETEGFSVTETGYYYIGIHNTSNDMFKQYVDNFLIEAAPITAPYTGDFSQEGTIDDYGVIDANNDGKTWTWSASNGAYYPYSSTNQADDYLILPIKLEAGKNYNVTVTAASSTTWAEKFEVKAGTTATVEGLSTTIIPETTVQTSTDTEYEGTFTPDEAGTYYVAIHATSDADMFNLKIKKLVIEAVAEGNAPAAVDALTVTPLSDDLGATISFNAPTKSIDGADLADGDITKIEILRDGNVIHTIENPAPGSAHTYMDIASDLTIGTHKYQVISYGASGIGGKSEEISVFLSTVLNVPYTFNLTTNETFSTFSVIDNNGDNSTWKWNSSNGTYYGYNSSNAADDYLISAPFNLVAGKSYKITVNAKGSASWPEKMEVKVGQEATAAGLNQTVIPETVVGTGNFDDYEGEFTVSANGIYYIAIHAISDADQLNLCVSKLSIEAGAEPTAPAATELTATPGAEGALNVDLSFTAPANAIDGSALSGTEDVKIYRDDVLVNTLTGVAPGSAQTWTDTNVEDGKTYVYYVVAANESGDGQKSNKVSVFVGQDVPAVVTGFEKTADTPTSLTFAWDEVTGANGGYVNPANAEYGIYKLAIESSIFGNYLVEDGILGTVTGETTGTFDYPVDEGEQDIQYFGASVKVGTNETDPTYAYTYAIVGAPYELPIEEGFTGSTLHYVWDSSDNARLGVTDDTSDGDDAALALQAYGEAGEVTFFTGKVNLNPAANPTIIFDAKKGTSSVSALTIFVLSPDGTSTDVETVTLTDEYQSFKVSIPSSAKNGRYNQVGFKANFPAVQETVIIDNIKICDLYQYNLSVDLTAPKTVQAGNKVTVNATVKNIGEEIIESYNLTVKAGDKELFNQDIEEPLAMFESKKFDIDYETTIFDEAGDVTITATVTPEVDLDETDNTSEAIITIKQSSAAGPENVTAEVEEDGKTVDVAWSAPSTSTEEATDDVESYDDFDDGGLFDPTAGENGGEVSQTGNIGDWTVYDGNNGYWGYGFNGLESSLGQPGSWQVFNPSQLTASSGTLDQQYPAHSGNKYFISTCVAEPQGAIAATDNWLISPELPGVAQTISFYVRELVDSYGAESYEVLASSTDKEIASFSLVEAKTTSAVDWEEVSVDLPAGTKYFAIRHTSTDVWALLVDDITFTTGGGEIDHYNIYVDGELVDQTDGTTFNVEIDESGEHTVSVSAVYTNGQESAPVSAQPVTTTAIDKVTVDGKPVDIYSIDGKLVRKQATSLEGLRGLYIINDKKVIIK